jgi:hypothetical protein
MAEKPTFNTELEPGDVTIYGIIQSEPERVGGLVKYTARTYGPLVEDYTVCLGESGTTTVYEGEAKDRYLKLMTVGEAMRHAPRPKGNMRQKGNTRGKTREQIMKAYTKFALLQVREAHLRAAADVDGLRAIPDRSEVEEASLWRAEARLASWERVLDAAEKEFEK